jgi:hypothetical protein
MKMRKAELELEVKTISSAAARLLRQIRDGGPLVSWDTNKTVQASRRGYLRVVGEKLALTALGSQVARALPEPN